MDKGFIKTVGQSSIRENTTIIMIIEGVVDAHSLIFKSDHSAPSGGTLNFSKNFGTSGILALQTLICVDQDCSKMLWQNSM